MPSRSWKHEGFDASLCHGQGTRLEVGSLDWSGKKGETITFHLCLLNAHCMPPAGLSAWDTVVSKRARSAAPFVATDCTDEAGEPGSVQFYDSLH